MRNRALAAFVLLEIAGASCRKEISADSVEKSPAAIVEQGPSGTSTWVVAPDGAVTATLKTPDGARVSRPVTGQLTFANPNGAVTNVPVTYDTKAGVLTAAGPRLDADITPVSYALDSGGTPWAGSLDVPKGGTLDLVSTAKLQPPAPPSSPAPPGLPPPPLPPVPGPNGGVVQTIGTDRVELVGNRRTGDVRAYVLDADGRSVDPGDRRVTVALDGERPEVLVLAPEPQGHFLVGHMNAHLEPVRVTIAVNARGTTHAALVGWSPGAVVLVGPRAPRVHLFTVEAWPGEVVVEEHGPHGRHHHADYVAVEPGVVVEGPSVVVQAPVVAVQPPSVVIGGPEVVVGAPGVVVAPPLPVPGGVVIGAPRPALGGAVEVHGGGDWGAHGEHGEHGGRHHGH